jgi:glutaredoxin
MTTMDNAMYNDLVNKILPLYDDGKYDYEPTTDKEKNNIKNRKREIKKVLISMLSNDENKTIVPREVCKVFFNVYLNGTNEDKIKELRSKLSIQKQMVKNLQSKIDTYEGQNIDRCPHCKADKDTIREKLLIEEFDDDHLIHKVEEAEAKVKNWVQKYQKQSRQAQGFNDQLQIIRRENEITPLADWRKMMEHHNETLSENKKLKDKVDKLEEKLCCRGDAKMMKRKKKEEKKKKMEEELAKLKAELSSCSDCDSDTD